MVQSVHQALGGGSVADVLLWRRPSASAVVLVSSTALWFLFEQAGYNLLSFVSNVLFLLVFILFLWAKSASLLNRPLPPLPDLEISEESISKAAGAFQVYVNSVLSIGRDIAIGRNLTVFLQVAIGLWLVSVVGSLCSFLTLCYIGVLVSLSVPLIYEKFQYQIDEKLDVAHRVIETQYKKLDDGLLKKIPLSSNKEKKLR